uniref:Uncharacterized protein n=1 Tax=Mola mola TaxID=94237 RepID=A0A3Q4AP78_MOLML
MGGSGSTSRNVSFGRDGEEKVTVIEGVKLSQDVLRRMREPDGPDKTKPPSGTRAQCGVRTLSPLSYERQQALVQEQLARLAQRERETASTGLDELAPALIMEKEKAYKEQEKANVLAKQLERKEKELASISSFYKEQLQTLEKKVRAIFYYITASLCAELQAKVLQCYRENPQQTLHCSSLAKQYMTCVQQAKVSTHLYTLV